MHVSPALAEGKFSPSGTQKRQEQSQQEQSQFVWIRMFAATSALGLLTLTRTSAEICILSLSDMFPQPPSHFISSFFFNCPRPGYQHDFMLQALAERTILMKSYFILQRDDNLVPKRTFRSTLRFGDEPSRTFMHFPHLSQILGRTRIQNVCFD